MKNDHVYRYQNSFRAVFQTALQEAEVPWG